jgi:hypothetical protein
VASLREELKLLTQVEPRPLVVVDELDALDDLVVELLYQSLRTEVALVIQLMICDPTQVLHEVLPQALAQSLYILGLPQLLHVIVARLYALIVVKPRLINHLPLVLTIQIVEGFGILHPFLVGLRLVKLLHQLIQLVLKSLGEMGYSFTFFKMKAAILLRRNFMTPLMAFLKKSTSARGIVKIFNTDDAVITGFAGGGSAFILLIFN